MSTDGTSRYSNTNSLSCSLVVSLVYELSRFPKKWVCFAFPKLGLCCYPLVWGLVSSFEDFPPARDCMRSAMESEDLIADISPDEQIMSEDEDSDDLITEITEPEYSSSNIRWLVSRNSSSNLT
ncbi:uncharacterized protein LOC122059242 [Macadamia integrifolia]|uniref:uncharacterized protein LOC122059242 n=1 Tax=Macadamia integrifolia TaxID=60698 RepID=UPI001C52D57D|nr:uncharacterized protein LOC122059242 [Macadamia integrifolia]